MRLPAGHKLRISMILTTAILAGELAGGLMANSLALLSDAGHVFTDLVALSLSWFAIKQEEKPAGGRMTFGYHRVGVAVAFFNAALIVFMASAILFEAYRRFQSPQAVKGGLMMGVAIVGLAANLFVASWLRSDASGSINIRSVFWHAWGDALASVGVIVGGIIILFTSRYWVDPAVSVLVAGIIGIAAWRIIREAGGIFLEAAPTHLNLAAMAQAMLQVKGVYNVHDIHAWTVSPQMHALSCHVLIDDVPLSQAEDIRHRLEDLLASRFDIEHSTIQVECVACEDHDLGVYCATHMEHEPYVQSKARQ